jgi:hypothetical protein
MDVVDSGGRAEELERIAAAAAALTKLDIVGRMCDVQVNH